MVPDGAGSTVISLLYVDDEPALLDVGKIFLERAGDVVVTPAPGAASALRMLEEGEFDAVVSDYQMPGMDGIDLLQHLRRQGNDIPFIIFTGRGREEVAIEALNSGADFYLQKGGDPKTQFAELLHKIRRAVAGRRAERELQQRHDELLAANERLAAAEEEMRQQVEEIAAAQQALRESRNRYRGIFENTGSATIIIENNTTISLANGAFERLSGFSRREIEGVKPWTGFVHPDDLELMKSYHRGRRAGLPDVPSRYEFRFLDRSGEIRHIHLTVGIIPETDRSVASLVDITERKRAGEERRILTRIVDAAPCSITVHDMDGRFLYANQRTFGLHGCSREEFFSISLHDLDVPESADLIEPRMQQLRETGEAVFEVAHRRSDGTTFPLRVHAQTVTWGETPAILSLAEDITGEKQAKEALAESEERLRRAVKSGHEFLFRVEFTPRPVITYVDPAVTDVTGFSVEDFAADITLAFRLIHPDDRAAFEKVIRNETDWSKPQTFRWVLDGGRTIWAEEYYTPFYDAEGRLAAVEIVVRDVTAQKCVEEALRESERRLSTLLSNLLGMAYRCRNDRDWTMEFLSDGALALTGYRPEEIVESRRVVYNSLIHPDDRERVWQKVQEALAEQRPFQLIFRLVARDGEEKWVWEQGRGIFDTAGGLVALEGYIADITEQRRAVEALAESEERFRAYFNGSPDAIFVSDAEGRFLRVNPAACALAGYSEEELLGLAIPDILDPTCVSAGLASFRNLCETGRANTESLFLRKDGSRYAMSVDAARIRPDEYIAFCRDITERKRAVEALRLANRKLQLLSAITRHDILNQVTALTGYLEFARERSTDPEQIDYLEKLEKAAELIRQQIEFTRDCEKVGSAAPAWQNVAAVIAQACDGQIPVGCDLSGLEVYADQMLANVLANLMDNTLRHGEQATAVRVRCHPSAGGVTIVWEDDGVGVPADRKEQIFIRGFGRNRGYGLFLIREILAITGMTIRETGVPGKGVRFEITVPEGAYRFTGPETA
ncbi:PAS domain S-box protein [Methanoculleus sp. FWC-SCC1]|uniref:histidine kinase n=1 Tax=Methanoculleus frigidifontis TaxID=2584085 RepID=A0ABT8MDE9_9EURY|nr:PAS domain S-box protein [Methanoculleus sp. FWC-SCC1]MDN7025956.1 PAS domain S-box protein [Methanoculleus sp. FWC-SCC1]